MVIRHPSFIVQEPQFPLRFTFCKQSCAFRYCSLVRHVVKHVLDGTDERWGDIIPETRLAAARVFADNVLRERIPEYDYPSEIFQRLFADANIQAICQTYEAKVSNILKAGCEACQNHVHIGLYNNDILSEQIIKLALDEKKLLIIARSSVRSGKQRDYSIKTAYRCYRNSDPASIKKKLLDETKRQTQSIRSCFRYVIHDKPPVCNPDAANPDDTPKNI